jgi:methionyl-tRNA formyltransferase
MKVIYMGTPDFAVPALRAIAARHDVLAVYSQPPRPAGRGQKERPTAVAQAAAALGLPVRTPATLRDPAVRDAFAALHADIAVVAAYGLILPQPVLNAPRHGCLNIHASLLPRWRGAAPIHRAILSGDPESGVTIMRMEAGLDTGPMLLSRATRIAADDTTGTLHDRLAAIGADLILDALDRIDSLTPAPQPAAGVTYAAKIDKAEARIDWTVPAIAVARQINALSPFPGAWCLAGTERLKLLQARAISGEAPRKAPPGTHLGGLAIACGTGAIQITRAQREGRRPMSASDILRGWTLPDRLD